MIITNEEALRIKCVDALPDEIGSIINQLDRELVYSASLGRAGVGLAAIQIGIPKNVAIVRVDNKKIDLVNCKISAGYDPETFMNEGCLSFPGRFEKTKRFQEILVENNSTYPNRFVVTGLLAVVVQHEMDHLIGRLLPDIAIKEKKKKTKIRPNDLCFCGSKLKYKRCHLLKEK